jgi:hypothetical protein
MASASFSDESSTAMVNQFLPAPFDDDAFPELDQWQQGSLIGGSTLAWAGPKGQDSITSQEYENDWEFRNTGIGDGWSVVTSQTCDISPAGPGSQQPFVQVSPLFDMNQLPFDREEKRKSFITSVKRWDVTYLAPVPSVPGGEGKEWAADLRISIPVSKGLLIAKTPHLGYPEEDDQLILAQHLAGRVSRPALHDSIVEIARVINDDIRQIPSTGERSWYEDVEQIRLELRGSRLHPTWVKVHIISTRRLTVKEKFRWRTLRKRMEQRIAGSHLQLAAFGWDRLGNVSVEKYRSWAPLHVSELKNGPFV